MKNQYGFTLFELMIAIAIIAILASIGLPTYQGYIKKAALTDMLQAMSPYKTAIELCALEQGSLTNCNNGKNGIPQSKATQYVAKIMVKNGLLTVVGKNSLAGLTVELSPKINMSYGSLDWARQCLSTSENNELVQLCEDMFKF